jgi:hypothetical protein
MKYHRAFERAASKRAAKNMALNKLQCWDGLWDRRPQS